MDIWSWVEETRGQLYEDGHDRLSDIMHDLPSHANDDEHDEVDALYAEALPLARAHPNKWIEVFLRHWHLQSQVLHRSNSRGSLSEAIDLLEFSHRDDTRDCPQSVCAVQDLANCYGVRDGPGFVQERLDVCHETFKRIDPSWPCFVCIGSEVIDAHIDNGDPETGLREVHQQRAQLLKAGARADNELMLKEAECLRLLGRLEEAESVVRKADNPYGGSSFVTDRSQAIALILMQQKRIDEALELMPPFDDIVATMSYYSDWHQTRFVHAQHDPTQNSYELDQQFAELIRRALHNGAIRLALTIATQRAELALARRDAFACQRALEQAEQAIPELNRDAGARASTDALTTRVALLLSERQSEPNPITLEAACDDAQSAPVDLFDFERLQAAHPEHAALALAFADTLRRNGYDDHSATFCHDYLQQHPMDAGVLSMYGHTLLDQNRLQDFDASFAAMNAAAMPEDAAKVFHWASARRWHAPDPTRALQHLESILALNPNARGALDRAAELERDRDHFDAALTHYERLIGASENPNSAHWDRIVTATLAQRWDLVRASCASLEIELASDDGPVAEDWGLVRIRFRDDQNKQHVYQAQRTGPVTARITGFGRLTEPQFYDHRIVFDARPLNQLDQKDDEGYVHDSEGFYTYLYDAVRRTPGETFFYFALDGMYPGDETWEALCCALRETGLIVSRRSSDRYTLVNPETDAEQTGIYALIAVPQGQSLHDVQARLMQETAALAHPLIWPLLAAELEDAAMLETQANIESRYGIT